MKSEAQLREYIAKAGGDMREAFKLACRDHHCMDQTLDMKAAEMERINREDAL